MGDMPNVPQDKETTEAVELFHKLSHEEKRIILDQLKSLLSER